MKFLIVEDEPKVAAFMRKGLEELSYQVENTYDGYIGKQMALNNTYDAIILDINLPHINGFEICKEIRKHNSTVPILMLTALNTMEDKLTGFDAGADDYLPKPFEFRELLARLRSLVKRSNPQNQTSNTLKIADLEMNLESKTVKRNDKKIDLTAKEFSLLEYLIRNKYKVVSRVDIAEKVWDIKFDTGTNVIDVYINFLRKKIDKNFELKLLQSKFGMGYILTDKDL